MLETKLILDQIWHYKKAGEWKFSTGHSYNVPWKNCRRHKPLFQVGLIFYSTCFPNFRCLRLWVLFKNLNFLVPLWSTSLYFLGRRVKTWMLKLWSRGCCGRLFWTALWERHSVRILLLPPPTAHCDASLGHAGWSHSAPQSQCLSFRETDVWKM